MKILYSCLSKSWGGMEMFTLTAVKQLLKRGMQVELLCAKESRIHIEANNYGIITHPLSYLGKYIHPLSIIKLFSILKHNNFDIVHTQSSKDLWIITPALKLYGKNIPFILTKQLGSYIVKKDKLHSWLYKRLTYGLAISNAIRENLIDTTPLSPDRVLLLHNGIDIKKFKPEKADRNKLRIQYGIEEDEILIGMLARFSPGKGHEEFLQAASELNKNYNKLIFIIVGEASRGEKGYEKQIRKLAEDYKLNNLIFSGYRSDIPDVLAAMDIFIFPSHAEAFGIALAEAMAMEKPSVCAKAEGVLDIAVHNRTSLLFAAKNGEDLRKKTEILINSPALRKELGKQARIRAAELFDIEKLTDKVIDIYSKAKGK